MNRTRDSNHISTGQQGPESQRPGVLGEVMGCRVRLAAGHILVPLPSSVTFGEPLNLSGSHSSRKWQSRSSRPQIKVPKL